MKKIISTLLAAVLLFTLCVPVLANYNETPLRVKENQIDTIYLLKDSSGNLEKAPSARSEGVIEAKATEDIDIYHISGNKYVLVRDDYYILCDRVELSTKDSKSNAQAFSEYKIPDRAIKDYNEIVAKQAELGNKEFGACFFAPSKPELEVERAGSTSTKASPSQHYNSGWYAYGGAWFIDYQFKFWQLNTGMRSISGITTKNKTAAWAEAIITAGGYIEGYAGVFFTTVGTVVTALSFLDAYINEHGNVVVGGNNDECSINMIYDAMLQYTDYAWYKGGPLYPGVTTSKIWLDTFHVYQYYAARGKGYYAEPFVNSVHYSRHYLAPARYLANGNWGQYNDQGVVLYLLGYTYYMTAASPS